MSCERFVHTDTPDMDWVCVCGHDSDWHGMSPSNPGGPCAACAESPVAGPYTEQETTNVGDSRHWSDGTPVDDAEMEANSRD